MDTGALRVGTNSFVTMRGDARRLVFRAYVFGMFTMVFCANAPAPLFELFRRVSGLGPGQLSMLYAVYAGVVIATLPSFGRLSDQYGRRALAMAGLGFMAAGTLVLAALGGFAWLVCGRLLQGLGIAAMSAPVAAALAELAGAGRQGYAASWVALALAAGGALAPLFSGALAEALPRFPTAPLLACSGMALVALATIAALPDPLRLRQSPKAPEAGLIVASDMVAASDGVIPVPAPVDQIAVRRALLQACGAVIASFGAQATFFTVAGPIFGRLLASHVLLAAGCAMCAMMVASGLGGILARRIAGKTAIVTGMCLLAPGVCCFFELAGKVPLLALLPAIAAIGLGHGLGYAGSVRMVNETAPSACRGAYTSRLYVAIYLGGGVPVLVRGILEGLVGQVMASTVFSAAITAIAVGVVFSFRTSSKAA
jgi:predicted MFS family arabinose efflux permease